MESSESRTVKQHELRISFDVRIAKGWVLPEEGFVARFRQEFGVPRSKIQIYFQQLQVREKRNRFVVLTYPNAKTAMNAFGLRSPHGQFNYWLARVARNMLSTCA
jgi:hypothetical protein